MSEKDTRQYKAEELEKDILEYWKHTQIFEKSLEKNRESKPYVFYDGPPFATGTPHYGSLLSSIVKDCIPRFQTMKGFYVRRRWGWDCHGLPIENLVEKKLGISGKKAIEELGVEAFNETCRQSVLTYVDEWKAFIDRIGRWVEYDNAYKTMDSTYQESVWWVLKRLWDESLVFEDRKVLLYCARCETPISNFEVAMDNSYQDVTEESVFVKFKLQPRQRIVDFLTDEQTYMLAWTTTPWTLPGNTALNVNSQILYCLVRQNHERFILAKERLEVLQGEYTVEREFYGRSLEGLRYDSLYPMFTHQAEELRLSLEEVDRLFRIYSADFVTVTDGTGIVHNAAMYGEEDYEFARSKHLPRVDMLDSKGKYLKVAPEHLQGKFFRDANRIVIQDLHRQARLYKVLNFTHAYPHCHRCGTPLYYNALPAWFVKISQIKSKLLQLNQKISWYPGHLKEGRFAKGIENAPEWNISRNRFWATALPFWKCTSEVCKHVTVVGSVGELVAHAVNIGDVYPELKGVTEAEVTPEVVTQLDLHRPKIDSVLFTCPKCKNLMKRVPEVVDCWVESGSMPVAELHYPFENEELFKQRFPADFVSEYIPQTRAWFYVSHVISGAIFGKEPFKNVLTTGTILAVDGSKMSKSKGNYTDPMKLIDLHGADALRWYLLASPVMQGEDLSFQDTGVAEVTRKLNLILWNTWSFWRMYSDRLVEDSMPVSLHVLDQWVLELLNQTIKNTTKSLDEYNTPRACKHLSSFVTELSTWYVRRSRERIKEGGDDGVMALKVLGYVLLQLSKLLAPFMPYLSEHIFRDMTKKESVHLESWPVYSEFENTKILDQMSDVRILVELGLSLRKDLNLKVRQPLTALAYNHLEGRALSTDFERILAEELNVKSIRYAQAVTSDVDFVIKQEGKHVLGYDTLITDDLRKEGLARELERHVQDLRKTSGLNVGQLVNLYFNSPDEETEEALTKLFDRKKTYVAGVDKIIEVEVDYEVQVKVAGHPLWLGISIL